MWVISYGPRQRALHMNVLSGPVSQSDNQTDRQMSVDTQGHPWWRTTVLGRLASATTEGLKCLHSFIANFAMASSVSEFVGVDRIKLLLMRRASVECQRCGSTSSGGGGGGQSRKNSSCWCQMSLNFKLNCWFPNWIDVDCTLNGIETDCKKWFFLIC